MGRRAQDEGRKVCRSVFADVQDREMRPLR